MDGLRGLLDAHLPYPALLLDSCWDVVDSNAAVARLLVGCDPPLLEPPLNALRLSLHPRGLAPRIRNLDAWAGHLLGQVQSRAQHTHDPRLAELARELQGYVGPVVPRIRPSPAPVLTLELDTDDGLLRLFTVAARLETPRTACWRGCTWRPSYPPTTTPGPCCGSTAEPGPGGVSIRRRPSGRVPLSVPPGAW